ncbi:F0F1 ATP synthase subunit epsilon [bacterium]|nr:F0F1 ATP synthase subunit epsilon [bacterium]
MATFLLEIVTPTRVITEGNVSYLRCPGVDGLFGVMADHTAAIIALSVGEVKITIGKQEKFMATSGGFADISPEKVLLLLETAEQSFEIDVERAKMAMKRAKDRLDDKGKIDVFRAESALIRAINRLKIAGR